MMTAVIGGLLWLLGCQIVGEVVARLLDVPLPGSVLGMVLLLVVLRLRRTADGSSVVVASDYLLDHLQLFFVPAGVGVVTYVAVLRDHAVPILGGLLGSWLLGLLTVGWLVSGLTRGRADAGGVAPESIE